MQAGRGRRPGVRTAYFNESFRETNGTRARYRILLGSAGSGKSVNAAMDYICKLSDGGFAGANLLVLRKIEASNRDSTFAELLGAIGRIFKEDATKIWRMTHAPLGLHNVMTGARILFRGMSDAMARERVKSIALPEGKLTWIWLEEATEFTQADFETLDDRLRGVLPENLFYQITMTFNPVSASHWLKAAFFDRESDDVFTHRSTYLDNAFIDEAFHARMERRKALDPDGYRVYGLGEWGETGGLILTNVKVLEFEREFDFYAMGTDFGFNHAWCTLLLGYKDGDVYILREAYRTQTETERMCELLLEGGFPKDVTMWCDSAEPDRIKALRRHGFAARAVKKRAGSVLAQIDFLKGRTIFVHPECVNAARELFAWRWQKDSRTGEYLDEPDAICSDDAIAALRYGVEGWRKDRLRA